MSFWVPLALAGAGLAKGVMEQGDVRREKLLQAEIARNSPWTGIAPQNVKSADPLGQAIQGGAAGMGVSQAMSQADTANALQAQQMSLMERQTAAQEAKTAAEADYYNNMMMQQGQPMTMAPMQKRPGMMG